MNTFRLQNPRNVRFPPELDRRVCALSRLYNLSKADLIRQALARQLAIWEREGITLAPMTQEPPK